jgi:putative protease
VFADEPVPELAQRVAELAALARMGLCNGYYFEGAGRRYFGRA